MTMTHRARGGRPRLDDSPEFHKSFATILPRLLARVISQRQAAEELGISVRSCKRYVARHKWQYEEAVAKDP